MTGTIIPAPIARPALTVRRIPTMALWCALATARVLLSWYYDNYVFKLSALQGMAQGRSLPPEIRAALSTAHASWYHYAITVLALVVSTFFVTALVQLALLIAGDEVRYSALVRAVTIAGVVPWLAELARAVAITRHGLGIVGTNATGTFALSSVIGLQQSAHPLWFGLLDRVTPFEVGWCALLAVLLTRLVRTRTAIMAATTVALTLIVGQWALLVFVARVLV